MECLCNGPGLDRPVVLVKIRELAQHDQNTPRQLKNESGRLEIQSRLFFSMRVILFATNAFSVMGFSASRRLLLSSRSTSTAAVPSSSSTSACWSVPVSLSPRLDGLDNPTVWQEFSPLAVECGSINLGQGFPDWDPPAFCIDAMKQATDPSFGRRANQYARSYAHTPLATVLAQDYTERFHKMTTTSTSLPSTIDPSTMIGTAVGCTNALFCALQGLVGRGDEVLLLEPAFDIYSAQVRMAGGVPVYCPLRPTETTDDSNTRSASQHFTLDMDELASQITDKTKVLILNTPHNPTGKVFTPQELADIADIVLDHPDLVVIADEVYEHIVFDQTEHVSIASVDGMWDRTLTLSSAGKTFSCTGWKVGWAVGPPHLVQAVTAVQQWCNFAIATPNQDAIAQSLDFAKLPYQGHDNYYQYLAAEYQRKRDILVSALESAGMNPVVPDGTFFIMADTADIDFPYDPREVTDAMPASPMPRDWSLSRWMTQTVGVTAIPPSAFYSPPNIPLCQNLLRFAFCKDDDTLLQAKERLEQFFV